MANLKATTTPCPKGTVEDPKHPGTCIAIGPVFSMTSTVLQGPDCWPLGVTVPTNRLGPAVKRALVAQALLEFEGLSGIALQRKLKDFTGRRARTKKRMAAAKKQRAK